MRNIFLFIRRFFNLILFLVLQGTAIYILSTYNKTHQAVFAGVANEVTGTISEKYNSVEYYFQLKKDRGDAWLYPGFNADLANQPYFVVRKI